MAEHNVTIDVTARFVDNVSNGARSTTRTIDEVGKAAQQTGKKLDALTHKHPNVKVKADTSDAKKKLDEAESKAKKLGSSKFQMALDVIDKASGKFEKIERTAKSIAGKVWSIAVKVKDTALAPLIKIKNMLFNIKTLAASVAGYFAFQKTIAAPISVADQYSSAKIGFSTLLGEKRGQQMMEELDAFAKETPFDTSGVIAASQKMLAMGWNANDIIKDMKTIGDAAAATGKGTEGLDRIVLALSQIRSKGKLSTEELNQLAEAGISAKRYIAEGLGYGTGDEGLRKMTKDLEKGVIGAEAGINAIIEGMKEYDGMMNKTANETVEGLKSQILDTFEINIVRRWGQGLQDGARKGFGAMLEMLDNSEEGLKRIGDILYDLGSRLSNWAAGKLQTAVDTAAKLTGTAEFQNAGLGGKFKILWDGIVADPFMEWWEGGGQQKAAQTMGKIGAWLGKTLSGVLTGIFNGTDALNDGLGEKQGAGIAESFVRGFIENFDSEAVSSAFTNALGNVWGALPWWGKAIVGVYAGGKATQIASFAGNLVTGVGEGMMMTGAGSGAVAAGTSAAGLGALTLGSVAGGAVAAGAGISGGMDIYKSIANEQLKAEQKKAHIWSGLAKLGGVGGGATAGAAIGSVFGGVGAIPGAIIGAGVGGLVGLLTGNAIKKEADAKLAAKHSGQSRKFSVEMDELSEAEKQAEKEAQRLAKAQENLAEHFGETVLAAEDLQNVMRDKIFGSQTYYDTESVATSMEKTKKAFEDVSTKSKELKNTIWLSSLRSNAKLTEEEMKSLKESVSGFTESAKNYAFEAKTAAMASTVAIMGTTDEAKELVRSTDQYYNDQASQLNKLSKDFESTLAKALKDNIISLDEQESLDTIRTQIAEITEKLQNEEHEAQMNILKAKYAGDLTPEGFSQLMSGAAESAASMADTYWNAFGRASVGKSEEEIEKLRQGTMGKLAELWSKTGDYGIGTLQEQYGKDLGILGEDIRTILDSNTGPEIIKAAGGLSEDTRDAIGTMIEQMQPTTEQAEKLRKSYEEIGMEIPEALSSYLDSVEFYEALAKGPEAIETFLMEQDLKYNIPAEIQVGWTYNEFDKTWISPDGQYKFTTQALLNAGWTYDPFDASWISPDEKYSFTTRAEVKPTWSIEKLRPTASLFGIPTSMSFTPKVTVTPTNKARGGLIPGYSEGGMVSGGGRLVRVAEEGSPEMIIPLSSQRRERGTKLWEQAGQMLRVPGFARGGLTDGQDEGLRFRAPGTVGEEAGGVKVDVGGVRVEIRVDGNGGNTNIAEAIRAQGEEIAETVAGILADAFGAQFENTPVRGGVTS